MHVNRSLLAMHSLIAFFSEGNGFNSVQLNGDKESSPHQEPSENRHTNPRKERKEILVGNAMFLLCSFRLLKKLNANFFRLMHFVIFLSFLVSEFTIFLC